ncbi:MAG TPA: exodeoxyribonuclease VII large subunit [Bacteroidota bacterium]|nr:exodeoxyribonuclease VII large subunit [Bacteroidota bacterium]
MPAEKNIVSVTEITRRIKGVLEKGFSEIWVQGEISNCKLHSSGHMYFTLKDEGAQLSAVMWRSRVAQMLFRPADGMKVIVRGNITVYEPRGNYQIDCLQLQPLGTGELQLAFDRLKQKLQAEGLFAEDHKKPLPPYPQKIGIITSPTGAAIQDILNVLSRRFPALEVIVVPVKVQGIGAADEIAQAVRDLNALPDIDVMIVGRGGGSLEDLWAFNEEVVARAIYASRIPVISAVGHEVDFSMSDFVADLRAPTPSAAAEMVVKDRNEIIDILRNFSYTIQNLTASRIQSAKERIQSLLGSYSFNKPLDMFRQRGQLVDDLEHRLHRSVEHRLGMVRQQAESFAKRIQSMDPQLALKRGYTMVLRNGKIVPAASRVSEKDRITVRFFDGDAESIVESVQKKK